MSAREIIYLEKEVEQHWVEKYAERKGEIFCLGISIL